MDNDNFCLTDTGCLNYRGPKPTTEADGLTISIAKWQYIVDHYQEIEGESGIATCGLCMLYFEGNCEDCPIRAKTGCRECRETPYSEASYAIDMHDPDLLLKCAKEMLAFLQDLSTSKDLKEPLPDKL